MKKGKKIINLVLLLGILCQPLLSNAATNEYQKGDLRCPIGSRNCKEIKDASGNVVEVDITYGTVKNDGDVQIIKKVKKTNTLGQYEVSFTVKGKNLNTKKVYKDMSIVLVLDTSATVEKSITEIQNATLGFYNQLKEMDTVKLAIIQFASNSYIKKNFDATTFKFLPFDKNNTNGLGKKSHVEKALAQVDALLTGDNLKYVVLLGDGQYWSDNDTDVQASIKKFEALRNKGIQFYMIQYEGGEPKYSEKQKCVKGRSAKYIDPGQSCPSGYKPKNPIMYNYPFIKTHIKPVKWWCNYGLSDYSARSWCANDKQINYNEILQEVADSIKTEVVGTAFISNGTLTDRIGESFSFVDDLSSEYKKYNIENITEQGTTTAPFYIEIDPYSETGWHETNSSFSFSYIDREGKEKTITCDENPQVYWVQQKLEIKSCSGVATADTIQSNDSDENDYYEKYCLEGYLKDGQYKNGFSVNIKINNLQEGSKNFHLQGGLGFPANISLSTNVMCQYKFKYERFNKDYTEVTTKLSKTTDTRELASLTKQKEKLDNLLKGYIELTKNDLNNYADRFSSQSATLKVVYKNSKGMDVVSFQNQGTVNKDLKCENVKNQTINGKNVAVNQTCYLSLSKNMQLPLSCLSMKTGEREECTADNTQIVGGSKFYTSLKETGGSIYVDLANAGYSGKLNVKLEDCSYNSGKIDVIYRQIDVSDPFNKNYGERKIGKNYLNDKYNFVNIIKSDIWKQNFAYKYSLSKVNIENIKKDTAEEGVSSYLGRNCYFNTSGEYVCDFTRNKSESGENQNNLFYNAEFGD